MVSGSFISFAAIENYQSSPVNTVEQGDFVQAVGTVILKGDIWIIRVSENNDIVDYAPLNLPKNYQRVGTVVKFAGNVKYISDTDKLAGITLVITQIKPVN